MSTQATQAAQELQSNDTVSPHKLISLLMAGTLERVSQAKASIHADDLETKVILMGKIMAIIKGLRESLDFEHGGDIAVNLDALYDYMIVKLDTSSDAQQEEIALNEVERLMLEVKTGWDGITTAAA